MNGSLRQPYCGTRSSGSSGLWRTGVDAPSWDLREAVPAKLSTGAGGILARCPQGVGKICGEAGRSFRRADVRLWIPRPNRFHTPFRVRNLASERERGRIAVTKGEVDRCRCIDVCVPTCRLGRLPLSTCPQLPTGGGPSLWITRWTTHKMAGGRTSRQPRANAAPAPGAHRADPGSTPGTPLPHCRQNAQPRPSSARFSQSAASVNSSSPAPRATFGGSSSARG